MIKTMSIEDVVKLLKDMQPKEKEVGKFNAEWEDYKKIEWAKSVKSNYERAIYQGQIDRLQKQIQP